MSECTGVSGRLVARIHSSLFIVLLLVFTDPRAALGQSHVQIRGIVVDASSGEPLPAAAIRVAGTHTGTITNAEGRFNLRISEIPAVLVFRYVGYKSHEVEIGAEAPGDITVRLQPAVVPLDEIVVSGEDPAVNIMRRVIARKQEMRRSLETYSAEAYNRFTISNDTGIVSIVESFTRAYWREQEGIREVNLLQNKTNNLDFEELLPAAQFVTNLYDDNIELGGFDIRGVTHPEALKHYEFSISDYTYVDDRLVYELRVEPASDRKVGFRGFIRVLADEYVMLEANLSPGRAFYFPPPFQDVRVVLYQQFTDFGDGYWLPSDLHSQTNVKIGFGALFDIPEVQIEQLSRLSNYRVNVATPDSLFDGEEIVRAADSTIASEDVLSWSVPMTERETVAFEAIDSTMTLDKAFQPRGLLGGSSAINVSASSGSNGGGVDTRFIPNIAYNRVEGFRGGTDLTFRVGSTRGIESTFGAAYITALKDWAFRVGGGLFAGARNEYTLSATYNRFIDQRYSSRPFSGQANSVLVLFGRADYFDYFANDAFNMSASLFQPTLRSKVVVSYNHEEHSSQHLRTSYDLVGRDRRQPANPPIEEGSLRSIGGAIEINAANDPLSVGGHRSLRVLAEHSDPDFRDSDFDFTTVRTELDWRLTTFQRRRLIPQVLDFRIVAAGVRGEIPAQKLFIVDASNGVYTPYGSLRTGGVRPFEGDEIVALFWEHNFRSSFFELVGAWSLARNGITLSVFGGHARARVSDDTQDQLSFQARTISGTYHEAGVSVGGILGILRVDVAKRLDDSGFSVGVSAARLF